MEVALVSYVVVVEVVVVMPGTVVVVDTVATIIIRESANASGFGIRTCCSCGSNCDGAASRSCSRGPVLLAGF